MTLPEPAAGRILVVDDNEMNRDMLSRRLRKRGYEVETAEDGRQALTRIEAGGLDLVLLDIMMPEMNGYEVLERVKADDALRHIPVIMISAVDEMDSIIRCIQLGAADYLPKPFNADLLRARVDTSLAVKRLHDRERAHAESLARELEIGRRIQRGFLPAELPAAPGWQLAARFRPAREVSGDFYDAFWMLDAAGSAHRRLGLVVADVCDKGVGAALFMALFRSLLRSTARSCAPGGTDDAHVLHTIRTVNDYIATTHGAANMFATIFFGLLDPETGSLRYVNGGHDAPVIVRRDGRRERLTPTGPAVGMMPELPFGVEETRLDAGDLLLAFTDGVSDALSADGSAFSEERLLDLLHPAEADPSAALARVDGALLAHTDGAEAFDDVTLLALARTGDGGAAAAA